MGLQPGTTIGALLGLIGVVIGAILTFFSKRSDTDATKREAELSGFRTDLTEARNETARLALRVEQLQSRQDSDRSVWDARAKEYEARVRELEYQNIILRRTLERAHIPLPSGIGSKRDADKVT